MQDDSTPTNNSVPYGFCHCGCGQKTSIAKDTYLPDRRIKGEPCRFISGHNRAKGPRIALMPGDTKTCITCHEIKDVIHFTADQRYRDGYYRSCRQCYRDLRKVNDSPEKLRQRSEIRAARIKANGGSHTRKQWRDLFKSYEWRCAKCGTTDNVGKDHVIPICKGGSDGIENIQPLCLTCNLTKGVKIEDYRHSPLISQN